MRVSHLILAAALLGATAEAADAQSDRAATKSGATIRRVVEDFEAPLTLVSEHEPGPWFTAKAERERFASGDEHFAVTIRDSGLPAGSTLTVLLNGKPLGTLAVAGNNQGSRLRLKKSDGAPVPVVREGDTVEVHHNGSAFLRGTFGPDLIIRMRERIWQHVSEGGPQAAA